MDLLSAQFNNGRLSLTQIKTVLGQDYSEWGVLQEKFKKDGNEKFYNERAEFEKEKRVKYSESRRNNLKNPHMDSHMESHMENENENRNGIVTGIQKGVLRGKRFLADEIEDLPPINFGSVRELIKISKGIEATDDEISGLWQIFKVQNLTGEKYYKSQNEVYSHFFNWINGKKINGTNRQPVKHSVKTAGAYELLEKIRATAGGKANP